VRAVWDVRTSNDPQLGQDGLRATAGFSSSLGISTIRCIVYSLARGTANRVPPLSVFGPVVRIHALAVQ
jgi:hypothetical protein